MPGWGRDDHAQALGAFLISCGKLNRKTPSASILGAGYAGSAGHWQEICRAAGALGRGVSPLNARRFFESWFQPHLLRNGNNAEGLFTGYFEPILQGSLTPSARFRVPLYRKPGDLVTVDLGAFKKKLKGQQITGRLAKNRLVPYAGRAQIERGALRGKGLELVWVDNPIDAFFLHIQGSGRVVLPDGRHLRVGYAGKNGQPYFAIGRDLVASGAIPKEQISLQSIRAWLKANPSRAQALMDKNKSYVFFRSLTGPGPIGAQGVPLTPGRSMAVDRRFVPLGAPLWLDTTNPLAPGQPLRRLVVAQDTGGAIKGVVRGDLFWGAGPQAKAGAGRMKEPGRFYLLLPRSVAPSISRR